MLYEGRPSLFPIKVMSIAGALLVGTAFYYGSKKVPVFEGAYRSLKYAFAIVVIFIVGLVLKEIIPWLLSLVLLAQLLPLPWDGIGL